MGKIDTKAKEYLSDRRRFADLFNYKIYNGRQVIRAEDLVEQDTTEVLSVFGEKQDRLLIQKWRDLLKGAVVRTDGRLCLVLFGAELAANIHYAEPVKNMLYDAINYGAQVSEAAKRHRELSDTKASGEFLSGFTKADRLIPVITVTVYLGTEEWDGPRTLAEMYGEVDETIKPFLPDYGANLLLPGEIEDFEKFTTGNRQLFEVLSAAGDKEKLKGFLDADEAFKNLENETVRAINVIAGMKIRMNRKEGVTDMCKAWEDQFKDGKKEGREEGRKEGREEGRKEGRKEGHKEGRKEGRLDEIFSSVAESDYSAERGAAKAGMGITEFLKAMAKAGYSSPTVR